MRHLVWSLLLAACAKPEGPTPPVTPSGSSFLASPVVAPAELPRVAPQAVEAETVFFGMCDASGAVALDDHRFVVADDEDNILRVYDAQQGGLPLAARDTSAKLEIPSSKAHPVAAAKLSKHPPKPKKPKKAPEADIEAAARIGDKAFWLTSHGRNSSGKLKPERFRLFSTSLPTEPGELGLDVEGVAYANLLNDLMVDPRYSAFELQKASELAPKEPGGMNIEGMTARPEGGVWIGFRNPTPGNLALLSPLLNPEAVTQGSAPRYGDPVTLDLGGLGIRSLSWWRGRYLIVAGHFSGGGISQLFTWDGAARAEPVASLEFTDFNPEGFFTPESQDRFMLLSDDGTVSIDGEECKALKDPSLKRFRGRWFHID